MVDYQRAAFTFRGILVHVDISVVLLDVWRNENKAITEHALDTMLVVSLPSFQV